MGFKGVVVSHIATLQNISFHSPSFLVVRLLKRIKEIKILLEKLQGIWKNRLPGKSFLVNESKFISKIIFFDTFQYLSDTQKKLFYK